MMPVTRRLSRSLAILGVAGTLLGAGLYASLGSGTSGTCRAAAEAAARVAPLAKGDLAALQVRQSPRPAPALAFLDPSGQPTGLDRLKGRTLLVNLWATWCAPCRHEMPALDRLQAALGGSDFEVVAVNLDTRNLDRPRAWLAEAGIRHLAYYADPQAAALRTLRADSPELGLPTSLIVDAAGCEIARLTGPADWAGENALAAIRAALGR